MSAHDIPKVIKHRLCAVKTQFPGQHPRRGQLKNAKTSDHMTATRHFPRETPRGPKWPMEAPSGGCVAKANLEWVLTPGDLLAIRKEVPCFAKITVVIWPRLRSSSIPQISRDMRKFLARGIVEESFKFMVLLRLVTSLEAVDSLPLSKHRTCSGMQKHNII